MTRSMTAQALAALILAGSAIAIPAAAQPGDQPISITVSYADLEIGHPAGANVLLQRLQAAAVEACGGLPDVRLLAQVAAFERCRREALSRAVAQINSPMLNAAATRPGTAAAEFAKR
jgi:UrcA family protein